MNSPSLITRRQALGRLSAGALLAMGLWPGCASPRAKMGGNTSYRFIVVNDLHYVDEDCGRWFEGVVARMKQERPEFCLVVGDLTEFGKREALGGIKESLKGLGVPFYPVIGNHDYTTKTDRSAFETLFPNRLNYSFEHRGWQYVGLDSTNGQNYEKVIIPASTFTALDDELRRLDPRKPTVAFTHFPLGIGVRYRPNNSDLLLNRLREFNLQAVFCGHFHGITERKLGRIPVTTNRCCSLKRFNHDNSREKGFFVCEASNGVIQRRFVECPAPPQKSAA